MDCKIIKPIPGTGYGVGEKVKFEKEKFEEYINLGYLEIIQEEPETAVITPPKSAVIKKKK